MLLFYLQLTRVLLVLARAAGWRLRLLGPLHPGSALGRRTLTPQSFAPPQEGVIPLLTLRRRQKASRLAQTLLRPGLAPPIARRPLVARLDNLLLAHYSLAPRASQGLPALGAVSPSLSRPPHIVRVLVLPTLARHSLPPREARGLLPMDTPQLLDMHIAIHIHQRHPH